jgi:hypothetical protein
MNPYSINPPESEVVFEELSLAILRRHWSRIGLERFAKKGEEQFGVDIFDTLGENPMASRSSLLDVHCLGKLLKTRLCRSLYC